MLPWHPSQRETLMLRDERPEEKPVIGRTLTMTSCIIGLLSFPSAAQQTLTPVKVLLDWAWLPYHATFLVAQEKGYYKEAGLDVSSSRAAVRRPRR